MIIYTQEYVLPLSSTTRTRFDFYRQKKYVIPVNYPVFIGIPGTRINTSRDYWID